MQTAFDATNSRQQIIEMVELFSDDVISHIELLRDITGNITVSVLQRVRYSTQERLNEIMEVFRNNDIKINYPPIYYIEDGKQGEVNSDAGIVKNASLLMSYLIMARSVAGVNATQ